MADKDIGANNVATTARRMGIGRPRVVDLTKNVFRKLLWPLRLQQIKDFLDEYNRPTTPRE